MSDVTAVDRLIDKLEKVSPNGPDSYIARCPAHADGRPSLSVRDTGSHVLIHCFAGCAADAVLEAVGLKWADIYPKGVKYPYTDLGGALVKTVHRTYQGNEKRFAQSGDTKTHTLYNPIRVAQVKAIGEPIYVVEGEKDVDAARYIGLTATCSDGGAGGWNKVDVAPLTGADVVVVGDQDAAGRKYVEAVVESLSGVASSIRVARPAKGSKDLADHVAAGLAVDDLRFKAKDQPVAVERPAEPGESWQPRDVAAAVRGVLSGTVDRPAPTIGRVEGLGAGIFYPGRVSGVHGESGVGKSWAFSFVAAQEVGAGKHVAYIDYEDTLDAAVQRLLDLGAAPADVEGFFHYVQPEERSAAGIAYVEALIVELGVTLVGIDSTGEGLSLDGAQPNADEEVAAWFRDVPRRLANLGPAVVVLDHSPKATGEGELFPIGSQRKRSAINGAQYLLRAGVAFSQGKAGFSTLVCAKDRGGHYAKGSRVARLAVSTEGAFTLTAEQMPAEDFRPTALMERVSRFIEIASAPPSRNLIEDGVTGNKAAIAKAIDQLVAEGFARRDPGPRKSTLHTSLSAYRQSADPKSDAYVPSAAVTFPREQERPASDLCPHGVVVGTACEECGGMAAQSPEEPTPTKKAKRKS